MRIFIRLFDYLLPYPPFYLLYHLLYILSSFSVLLPSCCILIPFISFAWASLLTLTASFASPSHHCTALLHTISFVPKTLLAVCGHDQLFPSFYNLHSCPIPFPFGVNSTNTFYQLGKNFHCVSCHLFFELSLFSSISSLSILHLYTFLPPYFV